MTIPKHFLKSLAALAHNGDGVLASELPAIDQQNSNYKDQQSENSDTMPPAAETTMDFKKAGIREVLDHFLRTRDPAAWEEFTHRTKPTIRGSIARKLGRL